MVRLNPITIFCCLVANIAITMLSINPIMLGVSFVSGTLMFLRMEGCKKCLQRLCYCAVFVAIAAALNPIFSRQGMTALFNIGSIVVTSESLVYGALIGTMLSAVMMWFSVMNALMDSDKICYIFGKYTPKIGTILTISLGLVPKYVTQYRKVDDNLVGLGLYENVGFWRKLRLKMHVMSTLITWAIEGAANLSLSMSDKGYDLAHKRIYSGYGFALADMILLPIGICLGVILVVFLAMGTAGYYCYPTFKPILWDTDVWIYFAAPLFMNVLAFAYVWGDAKWLYLKSKI